MSEGNWRVSAVRTFGFVACTAIISTSILVGRHDDPAGLATVIAAIFNGLDGIVPVVAGGAGLAAGSVGTMLAQRARRDPAGSP